MGDPSAYARRLLAALEPAIGKHTARRALELACKQVERTPSSLDPADHPRVAEALGPMLRTLVGRAKAETLLGSLGASET